MPRRLRNAPGGIVYHVLNRAVARKICFEDDGDFEAFEKVLAQACERFPGVPVLAYCIMDNHWHLLLRPSKDGQLSDFVRWLTVTHTQRWHAHHHTVGSGPLYQGRFKSFPVQSDRHLRIVARYIERNAMRAKKVRRARDWRWCSAGWRSDGRRGDDSQKPRRTPGWLLGPLAWPLETRPRSISEWDAFVDRDQTDAELKALREHVKRGAPFGDEVWTKRTASRLALQSSLRPQHRPKGVKEEQPRKPKQSRGKGGKRQGNGRS